MKKIDNWNEIEAKGMDDFKALPVGAYECIIRKAEVYKNGEYIFQTQNDGTSVCKSPMDMFEQKEMPNDLFEVDKLIREYYGFKPINEKVEEVEK